MTPIFFIQYELAPAAHTPLFAEVGGAVVNCFVVAASGEAAAAQALAHFRESDWRVMTQEEAPRPVARENYTDDPEWLAFFDTARQEGACYVYYEWPAEPQAGDAVH